MLEKMDAFFEARLDGYEAHMLDGIKGAREFYPFTAALLPRNASRNISWRLVSSRFVITPYFSNSLAFFGFASAARAAGVSGALGSPRFAASFGHSAS